MIKKTLVGALLVGVASVARLAAAAPAAPVAASAARPAAAPPAIVASLHLQRADATLTALRGYLPFPINPQDVLKDLVGDFNKLVLLSAPMDLVVALDPAAGENLERPLWGFALGITAAEDARLLAQSRGYLTDGSAGNYRMSVPVQANGRGLFCYLTTLPGGTGRLACSSRDRDRDLLGPYLGRLAPSAAAQAADLHGELLVSTLARTYAGPWQRVLQVGGLALPQRLALGEPKFDRAVTDATQALIAELAAMSHDLQTVALDLSLQQSGAQLQLGYRMGGHESVWAQADAAAAARPASGPPSVFWALPAEVTAASYRTTDAKWAQRLLELAWPIVDGYLEHDGLAAPDRQALAELLLKIPKFEGQVTTVLAEIPTGAAAGRGDEVGALLGGTSYLVTNAGQADKSVPWLRALAAAYNRPGLQGYLKRKWRMAGQTEPLPTLRSEPVSKQLGPESVALAFSGNFASLGRAASTRLGSTAAAAGPGAKKGPTTFYLVSATAGNRVWTAVGSDRAALLRRLSETPKLPPEKTLAQRQGLDALRRPGLQSGGFGTIAGFSTLLNLALSSAQRTGASAKPGAPAALDAAALLAAIPHHGEVPHTYGGRPATPGPQNPLGLTYLYAVQIPRLVLEDAVALVMNIALAKDR